MTQWKVEAISRQSATSQAALLELNNEHAKETSFLIRSKWEEMIRQAYLAICIRDAAGLLIVFDQDAAYDGYNFNWFHERFERFAYVDRIVVATQYHGHGLARLLYEELFSQARRNGHDKVVCEVNFDPPNSGSDAFHAALGFSEIGRGPVAGSDRVVRYLERSLD